MRQINVYFNDEEYDELLEKKDKMTWRKFILTLLEDEKKVVKK